MLRKYENTLYKSEKMNRDRFNRAMQLQRMCDVLKITDPSINIGRYIASIMRSSAPWDEAMRFFRDNFEMRVNTEKETVRLIRNNIEYSVQGNWFKWITTSGDSDTIKSESATLYNMYKKLKKRFSTNSANIRQKLISFIVVDITTLLILIGTLNIIK